MLFIELEPLCQKLWAFLSNSDSSQCWLINMVMSHDSDACFESFLFCPNFTSNTKKSHKTASGKALYFRCYQQKPHEGGGGGGREVENTPQCLKGEHLKCQL